jgi:hypothetical protein
MTTAQVFPATGGQGTVAIPAGTSKGLGMIDVRPFSQIRVVAYENAGCPTNVQILLVFTTSSGNPQIGPLDTITLTPGSNVTRAYDVPGTFLQITIIALSGQAD